MICTDIRALKDGQRHIASLVLFAKISMDLIGKGCWRAANSASNGHRHNRMIERLWRSLKYECIYLNAFETGSEARKGIGNWLAYYNDERPHSIHGILTPGEVYENKTEPLKLAA